MSVDEAIEKYIEEFGYFPSMLFMDAEDSYIIEVIENALRNKEEIKPMEGALY